MVAVLAVLYPGCDMVKVVFVNCTVAPDEAVVRQHGSDMVKAVDGRTEEAAILQSGSGTAVDVT